MDSKFIELHDTAVSELISLNVENICYINAYVDPDGMVTTAIGTNDGSLHVVSESYDEVKQMIKDSGIHIHKADPRLDTSHPLTMDDLQEMVGEPVWNSNLNVWMLIRKVDDLYADMVSVSGDVHYWTESDLKQFPLYRMQTQPLRERLVDVLREVRGEK